MVTIRVRFDNLVTDDEITLDYVYQELPKDESGKYLNILMDVEFKACEHTRKSNGCLSTDNYEIVSISGDDWQVREVLEIESKELLEDVGCYEMINLHNSLCELGNYYDDMYTHMSCFDEYNQGRTPSEIINSVADGFSIADDYFTESIYGFVSKSADQIWDDFDYEGLVWEIVQGNAWKLSKSSWDVEDAIDALAELADKIE